MDEPLFSYYGHCDACEREFTDLTAVAPTGATAYICYTCWRILAECDGDPIFLLRYIRRHI